MLVEPDWLVPVGGVLATAGAALFVANIALVLHGHGPHTFRGLLFGVGTGGDGADASDDDTSLHDNPPAE